MKLSMHALEPRTIDMRVDLRCGNVGMTEQLLDLPQIGTSRQQVCRKTVAKRVRIDRRRSPGADRVLLDQDPNRFAT